MEKIETNIPESFNIYERLCAIKCLSKQKVKSVKVLLVDLFYIFIAYTQI